MKFRFSLETKHIISHNVKKMQIFVMKNAFSLFMIVAFVSFLGFTVENL